MKKQLTALHALLNKYTTLVVLREGRESEVAWTKAELAERRKVFRAVAHVFPGALRELDALTAAELGIKAAAVREEMARVAAGGAVHRMWVNVVLDFHTTLARALEVKLWLARRVGRRGAISEEVAAERGLPRGALEELHHPPGGRLAALIWRDLQRRHGLSRATLEEMVFGPQA